MLIISQITRGVKENTLVFCWDLLVLSGVPILLPLLLNKSHQTPHQVGISRGLMGVG